MTRKQLDVAVQSAWDRFQEAVAEHLAAARRLKERRESGLVLVRKRVPEYTVRARTFTVAAHDNFYWIRPGQRKPTQKAKRK